LLCRSEYCSLLILITKLSVHQISSSPPLNDEFEISSTASAYRLHKSVPPDFSTAALDNAMGHSASISTNFPEVSSSTISEFDEKNQECTSMSQ